MDDKLDGDLLTSCLRQLVVNCDPFIRDSASVEQAEESLLHLEENDENFHKYEFVKALRSRLEQDIGPLIDEEIELHAMGRQDSATEDIVERITSKILSTTDYHTLSRGLKTNVSRAVDELLKNYDQEFGSRRHTDSTSRMFNAQRSLSFSDGDSTFSGSFNQGSMMFITQEQFQLVCGNLSRRHPLEVRREALSSLCQLPVIDQAGDNWNMLRHGVLEALEEYDDTLASLALRFIAKGFSHSSPNTREMYATLTEFLEGFFLGERQNMSMPRVSNGIELSDPEFCRLMKGFRLMNEFQHQIVQYWVRKSESFVVDIVERTLSLVAVNSSEDFSEKLTPVHLMALLDPRAGWASKWLHGNYSRRPMIQVLTRRRGLLMSAVSSCIRFVDRAYDIDSTSTTPSSSADGTLSRHASTASSVTSSFTAAEIDYAHFVHSFSLVTRLLCYSSGRALFPVHTANGEVTIEKFFTLFATYVANVKRFRPSRKTNLEPGLLVTDALKRIAGLEQVCAACLCQEDVLSALLTPLTRLLHSTSTSGTSGTTRSGVSRLEGQEFVFLQVADILSNMAGTLSGRKYLLRGRNPDGSGNPAAFVIADFVQRALKGQLKMPTSVVVAFVYICRQFYSTSEGLRVLRVFSLHEVIAGAWRKALADADALPPASRDNFSLMLWEDTLRDNLLNFAATPRGLLLLEQSGAITECVAYMYSRYVKKLQVSKCEKFGYGLMLTQVASTASGMHALVSCGFITTLIQDAWGTLEHGVDDKPVYSPQPWSVDTVNKTAHKPLLNLMNVLSSFPALYELLAGKQFANKDEYSLREIPETLVDFFDRIICINSFAKYHSLFNYEQSHIFGLRLMSVVVSSLDNLLLLQSQYHFQENLLDEQRYNMREESNKVIVDAVSVERNYLLVKTRVVGGHSERVLPPRTADLRDIDASYNYPMVTSYPLPKQFVVQLPGKSAMRQASKTEENPLVSFLSQTKHSDINSDWLKKCREAFLNTLKKNDDQLRIATLAETLEKCLSALSGDSKRKIFSVDQVKVTDNDVQKLVLSEFDSLGVELTMRYGESLKMVTSDHKERFVSLLKSIRCLLEQQQKKVTRQKLLSQRAGYRGFDWLVASMFLIFSANNDRCWRSLLRLAAQPESAYLWPHRLHNSVYLSASIRAGGIPPIFYKTCHLVEILLASECPQVASAFRMSGFTVAQLCQQWLRQLFWNHLDWPAIVQYICLVITCGPDYQVYFCVALLRHMRQDILLHQQLQDLIIFLKEEAIKDFQLGRHIDFILHLEEKYRSQILPEMMDINSI